MSDHIDDANKMVPDDAHTIHLQEPVEPMSKSRFHAFMTRNRNRIFAATAVLLGSSATLDLVAVLNGEGSVLATVIVIIACISTILSIDEVKL